MIISPADGSGLTGRDLLVFVAGINGDQGELDDDPKAVTIDKDSQVQASFFVPNGTLRLKKNTVARGTFIGLDVDAGENVQFWLESAFTNNPPEPNDAPILDPINDRTVNEGDSVGFIASFYF